MLAISGKEGLMALIEVKEMKLIKEIRLQDEEIISISEFDKTGAYIATNKAVIYRFNTNTCDTQLIYTCHSTKINGLTMMKDFEGIFGTCSGGEIVVWKAKELTPILKIYLPKVQCLSICFPKTGRLILSGWSDDVIRIFSSHNGKLKHKVAHANLGRPRVIITDDDSTKYSFG